MSEVKLKNVPMKTADGTDIKVGKVLYTLDYTFAGWSNGREGFTIEPHTVFFVNNETRRFRTRCKNNCESNYGFNNKDNSCSSTKFYGSKAAARKAYIAKVEERLKSIKDTAHKKKQVAKTWYDFNKLQQQKLKDIIKKVKADSPDVYYEKARGGKKPEWR